MPPRSSKRKSRRAPSDDEDEEIEEPAPTSQPSRIADDADDEEQGQEEAVQEEEDQPNQHANANGADDEEDEIDDALFDPATFVDQPLDSAYASKKISHFGGDYATLDIRLKDCLPIIQRVAVALEESKNDEKKDVDFAEDVDQAMRDILDVQEELRLHRKVIKDMSEYVKNHTQTTDGEERFEKDLKKTVNQYRQQTARKKYAESDAYFQFREQTWEVNHKDPMPPIKSLIAKEGDDSDSGSDIEIGGATQSFNCLLTFQLLEDPMTSRVCKHSFSRTALQDYFKKAKNSKADCPAPGCNKVLALADFERNEGLGRRAKAWARRERQREEEEAEDEMEVV